MLRSVYLALVLVRLYFALSPSYIHPDEHFQGPEIITGTSSMTILQRSNAKSDHKVGEIFNWPSYKTWEFTSSTPIRSVFPLWLVYGPSLTVFKWISAGLGYDNVPPMAVFYVLRVVMFLLSFILGDWAVHELLPNKREQAVGLFLVASSYTTWTYQMHTFSNSIETLIVLWCVVLMKRMRDNNEHTQVRLCVALAFLGVFGVFNRITFPAFLVVSAVQLVPHLLVRPLRIPIILLTAALTTLIAIAIDTEHYSGDRFRFRSILSTAVFTPWNNLAYNMDSSNLAQHGLHPFWQHFAVNLPQLIGPALPLLLVSARHDSLYWSGIIGIAVLSCFRHQEARFLLPSVPLLLSSIDLPKRFARSWVVSWVAFNALAGILFGFYHQAGAVPMQKWIGEQPDVDHVLWWKTYSPPRWLLDGRNAHINTTDLMGMPGPMAMQELASASSCNSKAGKTLLVAPSSATFLDTVEGSSSLVDLQRVWQVRQHIGLDDLDFGDDGVWPTLKRVIGRRGLYGWEVTRQC